MPSARWTVCHADAKLFEGQVMRTDFILEGNARATLHAPVDLSNANTLQASDAPFPTSLLQGSVYSIENGLMCVSCGGLQVRLPSLSGAYPGMDIFVGPV